MIELFALDNLKYSLWHDLNPKQRWQRFTPAKVRDEISASKHSLIMNTETYSKLCEIGIHVTPESANYSHQSDGKKFVGAEFSISATMLIYNELTLLIGAFLKIVGHFRSNPTHYTKILNQAGDELLALGTDWLRAANYEDRMEQDQLIVLGDDPLKSNEFIQALSKNSIFLIVNELPDLESEIAIHGAASLDLFSILKDDKTVVLPIFSNENKAKRFIGTLSGKEQKKIKHLKLAIDPLLDMDLSIVSVVLNYRTIHQRYIALEELAGLKAAANKE